MIEWYYHDAASGRVGPMAADALREHFRSGRLDAQTLVWRAGLPEWQPLSRLAGELGLDVAALPPPLPPPRLPGAVASAALPPHAPAPRRGLGGCAIAAIVLAVVAVPMAGILAAIALPAYQDYTIRAKVAAELVQVPALKAAVIEHRDRTGACAEEGTAGPAATARAASGTALETVAFGRLADGRCAFEVTLAGIGPQADGLTLIYAAPVADGDGRWDCSGGTLPPRYRPAPCRAPPP